MSNMNKKKGSKSFAGKKRKFGKQSEPQLLTRQDRQAMRLKRRHARPHGELVTATNNKLWGGNFSLNNVEAKEREARIEQILSLVVGKMAKIAVKHDVSRSLQCCVKFGNKEQRGRVFEEVKKHMVALAKNRYGHHLVLKLFQLGDTDMQNSIRKQFHGKLLKLCFRADSAKVVDLLYASGTPQQQHRMLCEFYGKRYLLLLATNREMPPLAKGLADGGDNAREIMDSMYSVIDRLVNKEMLMFRFAHALIKLYFQHASQEDRNKLLPELAQWPLALFHTPTGAEVLCDCLSQGDAKVRKIVLKAIKGRVVEMATHKSGHTVLMRALVVTDDTVLLSKTVLSELKAPTGGIKAEILSNPFSLRVLLQVLSPGDARHFSRDQALMAPPTKLTTGEDGKETEVSTVRKPAEQRRLELLKKMLPILMQSFATEDLNKRIRSKSDSRLLYDALIQCSAQDLCKDLSSQLYSQIAELATQPGLKVGDKQQSALLEDITGHIFLKRLLLNLSDPSPLASALSEALLPDAPTHAMSNRGAFVLMALMHSGGAEICQAFCETLTPSLGDIKALGRAGTDHLSRAISDPSTLSTTFDRTATPRNPKSDKKQKSKRKAPEAKEAAKPAKKAKTKSKSKRKSVKTGAKKSKTKKAKKSKKSTE